MVLSLVEALGLLCILQCCAIVLDMILRGFVCLWPPEVLRRRLTRIYQVFQGPRFRAFWGLFGCVWAVFMWIRTPSEEDLLPGSGANGAGFLTGFLLVIAVVAEPLGGAGAFTAALFFAVLAILGVLILRGLLDVVLDGWLGVDYSFNLFQAALTNPPCFWMGFFEGLSFGTVPAL